MKKQDLNTYIKNLPNNEKYKLSLSNSIWFTEDEIITVNEYFLQTVADYYDAGIFRAPFDDKANNWVNDNTDGMIKDIFDEIPKDAMYLVNVLAFDAEWRSIYEKNQVRDSKFTNEDVEKQNVEMMYSTESIYIDNENAKGFIKYYKDKKYAFVGILPNENMSVSEYVSSLDGAKVNELLTGAKNTRF